MSKHYSLYIKTIVLIREIIFFLCRIFLIPKVLVMDYISNNRICLILFNDVHCTYLTADYLLPIITPNLGLYPHQTPQMNHFHRLIERVKYRYQMLSKSHPTLKHTAWLSLYNIHLFHCHR